MIQTNLKSAFNCAKAAVRPMMKQRYGRIINITSVSGLAGQAGQTNYSASKAGMIGFTKALAKEVGSAGITVNAMAPGFVPTVLTDVLTEDQKRTILEHDAAGPFRPAGGDRLRHGVLRQRPLGLHHGPGAERRWWAGDAVAASRRERMDEALGTVTVAPNVLTTIVRLVTQEQSGVKRLAPAPMQMRNWRASSHSASDGVLVVATDAGVRVQVHIIAENGINLLKLGETVQTSIVRAIEDLAGMTVANVDVYIDDVVLPAPTGDATA